MGYNFFSSREISNIFNQKLNDFRASLGTAVGNGGNIPFSDSDISYVMKLQHDRINKKGLELDYSIYSRGDDNRFIAASNWRDAHYESTVCFNRCGIKRIVRKDGRNRYSDKFIRIKYI